MAPAHSPAFCIRRNAYGFPQDRATGYKIFALPAPNGSVIWTQFVHGTFYQVRPWGMAGVHNSFVSDYWHKAC